MMAEFLGIEEPEEAVFEMPVNAAAGQKVATLLRNFGKEKLIALAPGARWKSKQWPPSFLS